MKKFLAIILLLVSVSVFAQHRHGHYHGHHFRHHGGGNWVAPLIGGVIVGAVISDAARAQPQPPIIIQQPTPQTSTYNCLVQVYDPITRTIKNEVMVCVNQ